MRLCPARSCSPSTFWVIRNRTRPIASSRARARWPALGSAAPIRDQPRWARAQYRCWLLWLATKSWKVIGIRTGAPGPR